MLEKLITPKCPYEIKYIHFKNLSHGSRVRVFDKYITLQENTRYQIYNIDNHEKKIYVVDNFIDKLASIHLKDPKQLITILTYAFFTNECVRMQYQHKYGGTYSLILSIASESVPSCIIKPHLFSICKDEKYVFNGLGIKSYIPPKEQIENLCALDYGLRMSNSTYSKILNELVPHVADMLAGDDDFWTHDIALVEKKDKKTNGITIKKPELYDKRIPFIKDVLTSYRTDSDK